MDFRSLDKEPVCPHCGERPFANEYWKYVLTEMMDDGLVQAESCGLCGGKFTLTLHVRYSVESEWPSEIEEIP